MTTESPNAQWPEDFGHQSGDVGNFVLGVRNDNDISFTDNNLDYTPLSLDPTGAVKIVSRQTQKFASINLALLGDTTVVPAISGKRIRVINYMITTITAGAAVTVQFKSGALTVLGEIADIDGLYPVTMSGNLFGALFETAINEALIMNLSIIKIVKGHLTYIEV